MNVTVDPDTAYVPSPATTTEVFVQFGAVSTGLTPHNLIEDASSVEPAEAMSFASGWAVRIWSRGPATWSADAVGGARVVNETVLDAVVPRASAMVYASADVPMNPASPVNVTVPAETE